MNTFQYSIVAVLMLCIMVGLSVFVLYPGTSVQPSQATEFTYVNASADDIVVDLPFPGAVTGKEFSVIGKARGYWFFEASFPVFVYDAAGNQLAVGLAAPEPPDSEWMTTEFVDFKADLVIPQSYIGPATLVLKKDNPSGEPEHDGSVAFPFTIEY